jgi:hypothetical protein
MKRYVITIHTKLSHGWEIATYGVMAWGHIDAVQKARAKHNRSAWR